MTATVLPYRPFRTTVESVVQLSPSLRRIRFVGPHLHDFADPGLDQRIKLLLPHQDSAGIGELHAAMEGEGRYAAWLALPDRERPPMRTLTRRVRAERTSGGAGTLVLLEVDMVLHEDPGPAGDWARRARPGDELVVVGPDARYVGDPGGRAFAPPTGCADVVLVADETALPAASRILEDLAGGLVDGAGDATVTALVEVPTTADRLEIVVPAGARVEWLPRDGAPHGSRLDAAVCSWVAAHAAGKHGAGNSASERTSEADPAAEDDVLWQVPGEHGADAGNAVPRCDTALPGVYLWIAAESGAVRKIRRHLVQGVGVDRARVAFMGYWKRGATQE